MRPPATKVVKLDEPGSLQLAEHQSRNVAPSLANMTVVYSQMQCQSLINAALRKRLYRMVRYANWAFNFQRLLSWTVQGPH